ncbi:MAG: membrane fusion protein (multidrug efflux system) [Polaribacter sp.]|jgi:membrane fusion protein (multidrug efflux system)
MRKIILAILGALAIFAAVFFGNRLIEKNQRPKPKFNKQIRTVFVENVRNKETPIILSASGNLVAKNKIELFSEVQGVLNIMSKAFKAGTSYAAEETLLSISSDEFYAGLQSQKSNLYNLITGIMPDILIDYPNEFKKWEDYLKRFGINKKMPQLPKFTTDKEKYFISFRGILTAYYTVKNLEVRNLKYQIKAPFSGILTEALVNPGSLVRVGQKLGEYIDPSVYELEVSINAAYAGLLKIGNSVTLSNLEKSKKYTGKIVRVNGKVEQVSQTIKVFIDVQHPKLKEGMFLKARLTAKSVSESIEISRNLLVNNNTIYTVKNDSVLSLVKVKPVYFGTEKVIVKGIQNDTQILVQTLPGAFDGMIVKINKNK